jgi:hypothetical protein
MRMVPIRGFEGKYWITDDGNIYSKNRSSGRWMKPQENIRTGYLYICLHYRDNTGLSKSKMFRVHLLVLNNFTRKPPGKVEANHIDGNKLNNHLTNLEWVTRHENMLHSWKLGTRSIIQTLKMSHDRKIPVVGTRVSDGVQIRFDYMKQACQFGFDDCKIGLCVKGKRNTHRGYTWKREETE